MFGDSGDVAQGQVESTNQEIRAKKPTQEEKIIEEFKQAYKSLFGVFPTVNKVNDYYRVKGYPDGMSLKRLNAMTFQYRRRINMNS